MLRLLCCLLFAAGCVAAARAEVPLPPLEARVTDLTASLDAGQKAALEARLAAFEREKGSQIAVLILPSTAPETIEQFGIRLAEAWKIGRAGVDDGVILIVARDDRALRIEVGYGLEGALPDAIAKRIIEEDILPRFRVDDFYGGIGAGVERIMAVIEGEPLPAPAAESVPDLSRHGDALFSAVILPIMLGGFLRLFMGWLPCAMLAAVVTGTAVLFVLGSVPLALLLGCLSFVLVALGIGGRHGGRSVGGGGRSGGGGFSGGGGSFGGGGASGRW